MSQVKSEAFYKKKTASLRAKTEAVVSPELPIGVVTIHIAMVHQALLTTIGHY